MLQTSQVRKGRSFTEEIAVEMERSRISKGL